MFLVGNISNSWADDKKYDLIVKIDGTEMLGNITEVTDDIVKFIYPGEKTIYTMKKSGIQQITFANGRIEQINSLQKLIQETNESAINHISNYQNKVAILPISLIADFHTDKEELANRVQLECYNALSAKSKTLEFIAPATTNALLFQKGIYPEDIRKYTMAELSELLGVGYIVQATTTINASSAVYSTAESTKSDDGKRSTTSVSEKGLKYTTNVAMNVFDRYGKKIFGKDRTSPFWNTQDGYRQIIGYLAKKTPLYKK